MQRGGTILSHWHVLIDGFSTSGQEFYRSVEAAVRERQVPDADFSRVEFREFSFVTARREYLRVKRGAVVFDMCAAPYGSGYFFSWWLVRLGPKHPILYLMAFCLILLIVPPMLSAMFGLAGFLMLPFMFVAVVAGLGYMARSGVFGPEEHIIAIPFVGWLYEKLFSPVTYFSLDNALVFQESIARAAGEVIDSLLTAQGLQALSEEQRHATVRDIASWAPPSRPSIADAL